MRIRDARAACQNGRYDEAGAMLADEKLREFLPAKQLARQVAEKILERAANGFAIGDSAAGWRDLNAADRLGGNGDAVSQLRRTYADQLLREAMCCLAAGQPAAALARIEKLRQRGLADEHVRNCQQIASLMQQSETLSARGHFGEAASAISRAAAVAALRHKEPGIMDEVAAKLRSDEERLTVAAESCRQLSREMHAALSAENWGGALSAADALLAIAPQHVAASQARRRAWKAVGMDVTRLHVGPSRPNTVRAVPACLPVALALEQGNGYRSKNGQMPRSTRASSRSSEVDTVAGTENPRRALLWVDAVGGFLVCLDDTIAIGQPSPNEPLALPILADLSRRHAVIRREAGAYVLEPLQRTFVDGREIKGPFVLAQNQLIQLGDNVRIRFAKPHALSMTARLVVESHHKTQPTADAVLLMADSCVLGPNRHCHVTCRDWPRDIVIYRQNDQVFCRADEPLSIDGVAATSSNEIQSGARVEGDSFSFAWETLT
jgi:hypothetical protein